MVLFSLIISLLSLIIASIAMYLQIKSNRQIKEIQAQIIRINQQVYKLEKRIEEAEYTIRMQIVTSTY